MLWFSIGVISAIILMFVLFFLFLKYFYLIKVVYRVVLKSEDEHKTLSTFERYYWSKKTAQKDIKKMLHDCELIRSDYVGGDVFILTLINENYEIDYKNVHIKYDTFAIKPK
mgnify:CR=1 FL=1